MSLKKSFFVILLGTIKSYALFYGSPNLPSAVQEGFIIPKDWPVSVRIGFEDDICSHVSLKSINPHTVSSVKEFSYILEQGVFNLNFVNRFDAYGSLGGIRLNLEPKITPVLSHIYNTDTTFTWGVGARGILFEFGSAVLGLDIKYQASSPSIRWFESVYEPKLHYRSWQIGSGLAFQMEQLSPYIGVTYSQTRLGIEGFPSHSLASKRHSFVVKSRKKFGLAIGANFSPGRICEVDFEARVINELAFTFAVRVRI